MSRGRPGLQARGMEARSGGATTLGKRRDVRASAAPFCRGQRTLRQLLPAATVVVLPDCSGPVWEGLATAVLVPAGSAPGLDCEPHEVYHFGTRFVSCLLGQAVFAAELGDAELLLALGPSVDLLVLIPKSTLKPWTPPECGRCNSPLASATSSAP